MEPIGTPPAAVFYGKRLSESSTWQTPQNWSLAVATQGVVQGRRACVRSSQTPTCCTPMVLVVRFHFKRCMVFSAGPLTRFGLEFNVTTHGHGDSFLVCCRQLVRKKGYYFLLQLLRLIEKGTVTRPEIQYPPSFSARPYVFLSCF